MLGLDYPYTGRDRGGGKSVTSIQKGSDVDGYVYFEDSGPATVFTPRNMAHANRKAAIAGGLSVDVSADAS